MKTHNDIRIEYEKETGCAIFRKTANNTLVYDEEYVHWLERQKISNDDTDSDRIGSGFTEDHVGGSWISVNEKPPKQGFEVLLFNAKWKNEDFNPKGIRVGFLDDVSGWVSAYWCDYHDAYKTRTSDEDDEYFEDFKAENQIPSHWMMIMPYDC